MLNTSLIFRTHVSWCGSTAKVREHPIQQSLYLSWLKSTCFLQEVTIYNRAWHFTFLSEGFLEGGGGLSCRTNFFVLFGHSIKYVQPLKMRWNCDLFFLFRARTWCSESYRTVFVLKWFSWSWCWPHKWYHPRSLEPPGLPSTMRHRPNQVRLSHGLLCPPFYRNIKLKIRAQLFEFMAWSLDPGLEFGLQGFEDSDVIFDINEEKALWLNRFWSWLEPTWGNVH